MVARVIGVLDAFVDAERPGGVRDSRACSGFPRTLKARIPPDKESRVFHQHGNGIANPSMAGLTVRRGPRNLEKFRKLAAAAERLSAELDWTGHVHDTAAAGA
jgi:hypothetical protein